MAFDQDKCYEVLGVRPGVSVSELKAAYRDLAKVWHPDRFAHDPRLQQKAQEKLKEINDAYDQLISKKTPQPKTSPPRSERRYEPPRSTNHEPPRANSPKPEPRISKRTRPAWIVLPVLLFVVVFVFTSRSLIRQRAPNSASASEQVEQTSNETPTEPARAAEATSDNDARAKNRAEVVQDHASRTGDVESVQPAAAPIQPMATVTVMIDPSTGLLAGPSCPTKTRMTYPSGNEPNAYCNASHPAAAVAASAEPAKQKESKLKSFARRVATASKWLDGNNNKDSSKQNQ